MPYRRTFILCGKKFRYSQYQFHALRDRISEPSEQMWELLRYGTIYVS
jgi:hypothetical protein